MKFKPFCVKYEDWMTDEQVQEVLDKAVSAGASYDTQVESVTGFTLRSFKPYLWGYFGVDEMNETECYDDIESFGKDAVLLTLDQVDDHLGLAKPETVAETTVQPKSLANVKLDCRKPDGSVDEELSRAFQEACFEQGIAWCGDREFEDGCGFIYTSGNNLSCSYEEDSDYFHKEEEQEIKFTYERKLVWDYEIVQKESPVERKVVTIAGVDYYEDMIAPMLEAMQSARVSKGD